MNSILDSVKKLLGIQKEYTHFDADIVMHINTVFTILTQLGIGPSSGFSITDNSTEWSDFIGNDPRLESVKSFMYMKVRSLFDPPQSSAVAESLNKLISELEWRLTVTVDEKKLEDGHE